jgi:4-hydroxybenzoate polyprenyltransferase
VGVFRTVGLLFREIRFPHTVFALPFALVSLFVASEGLPDLRVLALVVVAIVGGRGAAMAFNRLADREIDRRNPRTAGRALATGDVSAAAAAVFVAVHAAVFLAAAYALNPLAFALAPAVLAVLLGYSYAKRFTSLTHFVLGLALGLAPPGAWIAARGEIGPDASIPLRLGFAVLLWVAGFDLLYACQDVASDREAGLRSVPASIGIERTLGLARALHAATVAVLAAVGARAGLGAAFWIGLAIASGLLVYEHRLVRPDDLSRLTTAFFTVNGLVSVILFAATAVDFWMRSGGGE